MREAASTDGGPRPEETFTPAPWLRGGHRQTLWSSLCRPRPRPALTRQRLELPDGDFLDLDWGPGRAEEAPLVVVLHGLEGSARSAYARALVQHVSDAGLQALVMHFRGCGGTPNRLARTYHSGETGDLDLVMRWLAHRWPGRALAAVGFSLGGNVLLKWLGERGAGAPVRAAAACCVPLRLEVCARRMEQGFSRLYLHRLLAQLKGKVRRKYRQRPAPFDRTLAMKSRGFWSFDDAVTAPLHGYAGADDYYRRASARPYLGAIRRPTLLVQSRDDPFMTPEVLPGRDELPDSVELEVHEHGGHVGFIGAAGPLGLQPRPWLESRLTRFLLAQLGARG